MKKALRKFAFQEMQAPTEENENRHSRKRPAFNRMTLLLFSQSENSGAALPNAIPPLDRMPYRRVQSCRLSATDSTRHNTRPPIGSRMLSAYHSEERKVQALYFLVVGINPPKPP
jgi:hypothetical protein